jgi:hypothetical protein
VGTEWPKSRCSEAFCSEKDLQSNLHPKRGNNLGTEPPKNEAKPGSGPTRKQSESTRYRSSALSAKPPSPVQIRAAPPNCSRKFTRCVDVAAPKTAEGRLWGAYVGLRAVRNADALMAVGPCESAPCLRNLNRVDGATWPFTFVFVVHDRVRHEAICRSEYPQFPHVRVVGRTQNADVARNARQNDAARISSTSAEESTG